MEAAEVNFMVLLILFLLTIRTSCTSYEHGVRESSRNPSL